MLELDASGNLKAMNVFAPDGLVARRVGSGPWIQYGFDAQGNVAQRLDASGNVLSASAYDAYGNESSTAAQTDPWGFNGRSGYVTDRETGLCYCENRYYDPQAGRWLSRDPIGAAGGVNVYAYCGSGPVGWADPSGLFDLGGWIDKNLLNDGVKNLGTDAGSGCASGLDIAWDVAKLAGNVGMQALAFADGEGEAEVGAILAEDAVKAGAEEIAGVAANDGSKLYRVVEAPEERALQESGGVPTASPMGQEAKPFWTSQDQAAQYQGIQDGS